MKIENKTWFSAESWSNISQKMNASLTLDDERQKLFNYYLQKYNKISIDFISLTDTFKYILSIRPIDAIISSINIQQELFNLFLTKQYKIDWINFKSDLSINLIDRNLNQNLIILEHLFYYNANLVKQVRNLNPNSIIIEIVHGSFNNKFLGDYVVVVYKDVKFKQEYYLYSLLLPDNFASNLDIEFYSQPLDYHYLLAQEQVKIIDTAGVALKKQIELYKFYIQKNNLNCELFYNLKSNFCMLVTGASNQFLRYYLEKESILLPKFYHERSYVKNIKTSDYKESYINYFNHLPLPYSIELKEQEIEYLIMKIKLGINIYNKIKKG